MRSVQYCLSFFANLFLKRACLLVCGYLAGCLWLPLTLAASPNSVDSSFMATQNTWYQQGEAWLEQKVSRLNSLNKTKIKAQAKNVILVIGDGMSITTLTAARIWQGQQAGKLGEEHFLHFEQYPYSALIKTYNSNQQSPDSAGTMSAIMTGLKTRAGLISIGPEQARATCKGSKAHQQKTLLEWAHEANYASGIVTTARLTHATPAATYAHSPERLWESDLMRYPNAYLHGCDSIAKQLIEKAFPAGLDIAFGGGDIMLNSHYDRFKQQFSGGKIVRNQQELLSLPSDLSVRPILGVFATSHMAYEVDRSKSENQSQPSLKQMAEQALLHLQTKEKLNGENYLLVVEGARIDQAHHAGNAARALSETAMLAETVQRLDELTADDNTLIIVTADHSHNFVMAGYPKRGNPILATSKNQLNEEVLANDGLPYTTLGYANGEAFGRRTHNNSHTEAVDYHQGVAVPLDYASHGSDDVALHAKGPGAHLFTGLMEQHEIFHTIVEALNWQSVEQPTQTVVRSAESPL